MWLTASVYRKSIVATTPDGKRRSTPSASFRFCGSLRPGSKKLIRELTPGGEGHRVGGALFGANRGRLGLSQNTTAPSPVSREPFPHQREGGGPLSRPVPPPRR